MFQITSENLLPNLNISQNENYEHYATFSSENLIV